MAQIKTKKQKTKRGWPTIFFQVIASAIIAAIFVLYVYLIQQRYDEVLKANAGVHNFETAMLFVLIIVLGGFSYDCAKTILLLRAEFFSKFIQHCIAGIIYTVITIVLSALGLLLWSNKIEVPAALLLFGTGVFSLFAINEISDALETAAN